MCHPRLRAELEAARDSSDDRRTRRGATKLNASNVDGLRRYVGAVTYRHPVAFLLGFEGLALHRAFAGEFDAEFVEARIAEVRTILAAWDRGELGTAERVGVTGTVAGYRVWSRTYDEPGNPLIAVDEPIALELIDRLPARRALDAACGTGRFAALLAARGHEVVGVDSSPDMLAVARRKVPAATFVRGDLSALPLADASVDLVVCGLALTHTATLEPVFAEFARVLRSGGHLITTDIHWQSL